MNAFKRKISLANEEAAKQKIAKLDVESTSNVNKDCGGNTNETPGNGTPVESNESDIAKEKLKPVENQEVKEADKMEDEVQIKATDTEMEIVNSDVPPNPIIANIIEEENANSPLRRGSQESTATTTTQTTTSTGTDSTSSSSDSSTTDTSSSDTDDSSSEDDLNKVNYSFIWKYDSNDFNACFKLIFRMKMLPWMRNILIESITCALKISKNVLHVFRSTINRFIDWCRFI